MRIAVLLARDVSGSDFFPFGVKGSTNTRLFGRRTMGAFSTFYTLEAQGFFYWSLASGDFIGADGRPNIGHGVEPDEVLLPKQSDLMVGKDTVYERALAWVRCGEEVCP
jgi:C-terminal processing protease CtpA/Prc